MSEIDPESQDAYQLSVLQTGLLYEEMGIEAASARPYIIQQIDSYTGRADIDAVIGAYEALVSRHPILRTGFVWDGDEPRQFVRARADLPVTRLDWSSVPAQRCEQQLAALVDEDRRTPFDMACAPLARLTVVTMPGDELRTLFSIHHILVDDWAWAVLEAEFDIFYRAAVAGGEPELPPAPSFGDYVRWQSGVRAAPSAEKRFFWRDYLAGAPEAWPLGLGAAPADAPFVRARACLSTEETAQLEGFARAARVSLNTVVNAAWALALSVLTGTDDVVFGFTAVSRPDAVVDAESLVGPCLSTLPLRVVVDRAKPMRDWLRELQGGLIDLWDDEALPVLDTGALARRKSGDRESIESIVVVEGVPRPKVHLLPDTVKTRMDSINWTGYPVVVAAELGDGLDLTVTLDGRRGDTAAAQSLAERLKHILLQFTDLQAPVGTVDVLDPGERAGLLEWGAGPAGVSSSAGLAERFALQVRRTPDAVAVEAADGTAVTYAELDARSDRLAWLLRGAGAGPERFVAVAMGRSVDLVVAFLAVVKAGAAYVPLPASYPLGLALDVVRDMEPVVLLTDAALRDGEVVCGIAEAGLPVITVDALACDCDGVGCGCDSVVWGSEDGFAGLDQVAYVMFTSGSTGVPKGVSISQRNVLALVDDGCWRG
ncbi:AMP-binding protein, partial [Catenulispora sp. NL8]